MFLGGKIVLKGLGSFIWCLGFLLLRYSVVHICIAKSFAFFPFYILICMYLEMMHRIVRDLSCLSNNYVSCSTSVLRVRLVSLNMFKPSSFFSADRCKEVVLLWVICCCLCFMLAIVMLSCMFLAALWSPAGKSWPLALLCVVLSCVFVTFQCGFSYHVWYLIVSIPDLCPPLYFVISYLMWRYWYLVSNVTS